MLFEILFTVLMFLGVCFIVKGFELKRERQESEADTLSERIYLRILTLDGGRSVTPYPYQLFQCFNSGSTVSCSFNI